MCAFSVDLWTPSLLHLTFWCTEHLPCSVIEAEGKSRALKITAKAEADAVVTRAEGALTGARKLEQSDVAIDLARIEKTGDAIQNKSSFFFGANSADMGHLLANPNVIKLQK